MNLNGNLDNWTSHWQKTVNTLAQVYGSSECIGGKHKWFFMD